MELRKFKEGKRTEEFTITAIANKDEEGIAQSMPLSTSVDYVAKNFGVENFIEGCSLSTHPKMVEFMAIYNSLSEKEKKSVSLNEICNQVELQPDILIANVAQSLARYNHSITKMLIAINKPKVIMTNIQMAQTSGGFEDRKMFLNMAGMQTEQAKGPLISQTFNNGTAKPFEDDPTMTLSEDGVIDVPATFDDKGESKE